MKENNAKLREDQVGLSWGEVRVMLEGSHARLVRFIMGMSDTDLYGGPMKGGGNKWGAGPRHQARATIGLPPNTCAPV